MSVPARVDRALTTLGLGFRLGFPFNLSVQSRTPVSRRNARFEPGLIVQRTVDILKNGDSRRDTSVTIRTSVGSNNLNVMVRVGVMFPFKLLIQSRTPVSGRNIEKRLVRTLYMIRTSVK